MRSARPYRSHKYPACTRCHKRRSRCTIDRPGEACLVCRVSGVVCSAEATSRGSAAPRFGFIQRTDSHDVEFSNHTHIIGPVVARDTQVLDTLIPGIEESATPQSSRLSPVLRSSTKPIYRTGTPSRRPSPPTCRCSGQSSGRLLQHVQPILDELVEVYLEHLHPCLPLLDEQKLRSLFLQRSSIPKTLLLNFIAYVMFYRHSGRSIADTADISQDVAWQAAVEAMNGDSQRSDMFTLLAIALNIAGRPSIGVVHNTSNVARITALAHSVGMNHDCSDWNMSESEKNTRSHLWWAILIHDRWFNFAQGTPPYIHRDHYDVPVPRLSMLVADHPEHTRRCKAAECYIQLCKLTEIVGEILPLIYHLRSRNDGVTAARTMQAETALDTWIQEQPTGFGLHDFENRQSVPGLANLQLSYLSTRMLLVRIAWHEDIQQIDAVESPWLQKCLSAAGEVVRFVQSLVKVDLMAFWLPYNAHHFASAVTLLLRCAVQTRDICCLMTAMKAARQLVDSLISLQVNHHWDMAETTLPQSKRMLGKIEEALPVMNVRLQDHVLLRSSYHNDMLHRVDETLSSAELPQFSTFEFQIHDSMEVMFPELFSEFTDDAFFDNHFY